MGIFLIHFHFSVGAEVKYPVRHGYHGWAVGNKNSGDFQRADRIINSGFIIDIQITGRFVEKEYSWAFVQGAGQRNTLPLPTG